MDITNEYLNKFALEKKSMDILANVYICQKYINIFISEY